MTRWSSPASAEARPCRTRSGPSRRSPPSPNTNVRSRTVSRSPPNSKAAVVAPFVWPAAAADGGAPCRAPVRLRRRKPRKRGSYCCCCCCSSGSNFGIVVAVEAVVVFFVDRCPVGLVDGLWPFWPRRTILWLFEFALSKTVHKKSIYSIAQGMNIISTSVIGPELKGRKLQWPKYRSSIYTYTSYLLPIIKSAPKNGYIHLFRTKVRAREIFSFLSYFESAQILISNGLHFSWLLP